MTNVRALARRRVRRFAGRLLRASGASSRFPGLAERVTDLGRRRGLTVAEGWDAYAKRHTKRAYIGEAWNNPRIIGLDVESTKDVVPYLDREVFQPFLGTVDAIVEIGPGGGRFTEILLPKCRTLHAVDTSPKMIEALRERFGADERLVYHVGNGLGLDMLGDESVDAAFSYGVFVHLQHWDIYNYLAEVKRVLKPGGKAIIQHSNSFSELGWKKFLADVPRQLNRHKLPKSFILNSPELMSELIRRAGLEPLDMVTNVARRDCIALIRKPA
jgi:SAM-dependent methyltransferase